MNTLVKMVAFLLVLLLPLDVYAIVLGQPKDRVEYNDEGDVTWDTNRNISEKSVRQFNRGIAASKANNFEDEIAAYDAAIQDSPD